MNFSWLSLQGVSISEQTASAYYLKAKGVTMKTTRDEIIQMILTDYGLVFGDGAESEDMLSFAEGVADKALMFMKEST